jgi:IstB-like ATP binding protein
MARWIYQRPIEYCDPTELIVAKRLALLPDGWVIRWGFYYDSDREGDFLILGPTGGALVLEVKGGGLRKLSTTGRWNGPDRDHPLAQLSAEWGAILGQLKETANGNAVPFVAKALCLADQTIDPKTPAYKEIDRNLIVDRVDLAAFETTWDRLFPRHHPVPEEERKVFLDTFAKDISPKELKHFVTETDRILLQQTIAEYQVLDLLRDNRQLVVQGGPGSGKTWLALEQAFRYAEEGLQVLFLCYNVALADQLSALVAKRKLKKGEVVVRSWAGLARELLEAVGLEWDEPTGLTESNLYFGEVVPSLMREIAQDQQFEPRFDALVVDEAQDQDTSWPELQSDEGASGWWEVYWRLLREKTSAPMAIFYDSDQRQLFRRKEGFDPTRIFKRLSQPAHASLLFTHRYSRSVFEFLQTLRSDATSNLVRNLRYRTILPEGPDVELYTVKPESTVAKLEEIVARWVREGFCRVDEILILSPHGTKVKTSLAGCSQIGEWPLASCVIRKPGELSLLSINKAKGLDSLAVIMIDTQSFDKLSNQQQQMDYFMGASRSRQLLAILHREC